MPKLPSPMFRFLSRLWGPFFGAGIRITKLAPDYREVETRLRLTWYNKNWVGTHYGGSLFSMTDPFHMFLLINNIGSEHYVWDKSSCITFVKAGKKEVIANIKLSDEVITDIVERAKDGKAHYHKFDLDIVDTDGEVIAQVDKTIYVRRKPGHR